MERADQNITRVPRGIIQWFTSSMRYPRVDEIAQFNAVDHIWKRGDKFYKLAHEHYGDSKLWWIIPWFNKKPFIADYKFGDVVHIPLSISKVYEYFD